MKRASQTNSSALVYVVDERIIGPTLISALSFEKATGDLDIIVFVAGPEISGLQAWLAARPSRIQVRFVEQAGYDGFGVPAFLTPAAFGRLELHNWLGDTYERVIYLDGDTLAGPQALNPAVDLQGAVLGAADDLFVIEQDQGPGLRRNLGLSDQTSDYFNSGVLVMDWKKWREAEIGERALAYLRRNPDLTYGDQCALNRVCDGLWHRLDISWNCQTPILGFRREQSTARVFHFVGGRKPWHLDKWRGPGRFSRPYREQLSEIPVPGILRPATWSGRFTRTLRPLERRVTAPFKTRFDWLAWLEAQGRF